MLRVGQRKRRAKVGGNWLLGLRGWNPKAVKKAKGGLKHRLRLIFLFTFCIKAKSKTLAVAKKIVFLIQAPTIRILVI